MAFIRFADRPTFRNPWAEFERIRQGLDELSRSYADKGKPAARATVYPALNIYEEPDRLVITAESPRSSTSTGSPVFGNQRASPYCMTGTLSLLRI